MLSCGRVRRELFENADVTVSIYNPSEQCPRIFGDHARAFCLSVFGFRISQRFRVDVDNFENAPRVEADIFDTDVFSKISG